MEEQYKKGFKDALAFVKGEISDLVKALEKQHPDPLGNTVQMLADAEIMALNVVTDTINEKEKTL